MTPLDYPKHLIGAQLTLMVPFSFETGEAGTIDLPTLPYRAKILTARAVVQKAVAATDSGTIAIKKGSTAYGTITYSASAGIGTAGSATVTDNTFEVTDQIRMVTAKATAGGKGLLMLVVEVLPSH